MDMVITEFYIFCYTHLLLFLTFNPVLDCLSILLNWTILQSVLFLKSSPEDIFSPHCFFLGGGEGEEGGGGRERGKHHH